MRVLIGAILLLATSQAFAQSPAEPRMAPLSLGFAVDTTAIPRNHWGMDTARSVLPEVVRFWRDYLAIRHDSTRRRAHWMADSSRPGVDVDPVPTVASYLLTARPQLVEALPVQAENPARWQLRTIYSTGGAAMQPALLGFEQNRVVGVRDASGVWSWKLEDPALTETATWSRHQVGLLSYVVHPDIEFNHAKAQATAIWADSVLHRFGLERREPITYYQVPDLQAGFRIYGFTWMLSADRVGGRAGVTPAVVVAADPRYGEAYRHEIAHVLLAPLVAGRSHFVVEGLSYWIGGARGSEFVDMMRSGSTFWLRNSELTFDQILSNGATGAAASLQLPVAASIFELIHRRGGDRAVRDVIGKLGTTSPTMEQVADAMGLTPPALVAAWRDLMLEYAR